MEYNNDYELKEYVGESVSVNERQWDVSAAFPILMRKVYVWMTLALAITGITAYGVVLASCRRYIPTRFSSGD